MYIANLAENPGSVSSIAMHLSITPISSPGSVDTRPAYSDTYTYIEANTHAQKIKIETLKKLKKIRLKYYLTPVRIELLRKQKI